MGSDISANFFVYALMYPSFVLYPSEEGRTVGRNMSLGMKLLLMWEFTAYTRKPISKYNCLPLLVLLFD